MIWRRVLVPASVSLRELHGTLQVGMSWEGIHLYYFDIIPVSRGWPGQSHFKLPLPILAASTLHRDCKGVVSA